MSIWLRNRQTGEQIAAQLELHVSKEQIAETECEWTGYRSSVPVETLSAIPESNDWNWLAKYEASLQGLTQFLGIRLEGKLQGMLQLDLVPRASRTNRYSVDHVLYVEYLETAPWNQKAYMDRHARFGGVGLELILGAIEMSVAHGCHGSLGLHSLPGALGFYLSLRFKDYGPDSSEEGLHYLELSPSDAVILKKESAK